MFLLDPALVGSSTPSAPQTLYHTPGPLRNQSTSVKGIESVDGSSELNLFQTWVARVIEKAIRSESGEVRLDLLAVGPQANGIYCSDYMSTNKQSVLNQAIQILVIFIHIIEYTPFNTCLQVRMVWMHLHDNRNLTRPRTRAWNGMAPRTRLRIDPSQAQLNEGVGSPRGLGYEWVSTLSTRVRSLFPDWSHRVPNASSRKDDWVRRIDYARTVRWWKQERGGSVLHKE